jgi:hypothetical protein
VVEPGAVLETERVRITTAAPNVCDRLAEAGRYDKLSRGMPDRGIAGEWDKIAAALEAEITVSLPCYRAERVPATRQSHG